MLNVDGLGDGVALPYWNGIPVEDCGAMFGIAAKEDGCCGTALASGIMLPGPAPIAIWAAMRDASAGLTPPAGATPNGDMSCWKFAAATPSIGGNAMPGFGTPGF